MPPIPAPIFPPAPLTAIADLVLDELRNAPTLAAVMEWRTFSQADDWLAVPLQATPAVLVSFRPGEFRWTDECRHRGPLHVDLELAVPSTDFRELLNFQAAVARVLAWRPSEDPASWRQRARAAGAVNCVVTTPPGPPRAVSAGRGLAATASIRLDVDVSY